MLQTESTHRPVTESQRLIREAVARADRRRRIRDASRGLWRVAPVAAAVGLGVAAGSRWAGWPARLPLAVLALGTIGVTAYTFVGRREREISDAAAAEIDADASLRGELRSASWFAARDAGSDWTDLHLDRAAARLEAMDWTHLYPVARARGPRIATTAMVVGALALVVVTFPGRSGIPGTASASTAAAGVSRGGPALQTNMLPPALPKQLEDLLKAAEAGAITPAANAAAAAQLRDVLAQLGALQDPRMLAALAEAMAAHSGPTAARLAQKMQALADRAKRAADLSMTRPDIRTALEDLSKELARAAESQSKNGEDPSSASAGKDSSQGESGKADAGKNGEDASLQFSKDAGAGSGIGVLMTSSEAPPSGDVLPGVGVGGSSSDRKGGGTMAELERALRKETVEASADSAGENVVTTGARRKTAQGNATVTFTRGAGTLDRGRAAAPPPVPEARRSGLQAYFVRKQ